MLSNRKGFSLVWLLVAILFCDGNANSNQSTGVWQDIIQGTVPIGQGCNNNDDCADYPDTAVCDPILGFCWCRDDHEIVPPEEGTIDPIICAPIRQQIGDPCLVKGQCTKGEPGDLSDCLPSFDNPNQLVCNCTEGNIYEPGEHKCFPIRSNVGEQCIVNAQCRFNLGSLSECDNPSRECICSRGIAIPSLEMDKCLPIRDQLLQECSITSQCTLGVPGLWSDCLEFQEGDDDGPDHPEKVCNCTADAINEPGEHKCYPRRDHIGQICEVTAQCEANMGELSECTSGKCECDEDKAVENIAKTFCLPIVDLIGGPCEEPQQCIAGDPGDLSGCIPSPDDPSNLVCNCSDDAINQPGDHICHKKATIVNDPCLVEAQCTANLGDLSECVISGVPGVDEGSCVCKDGSVPRQNGTHCLAIRDELGNECSEPQQCQEGEPGFHSDCVEGECRCTAGATNEPGENLCRPRAELVGDACDVSSQCKANLGELSECTARQCRCNPVYGVPNQDADYCLPVVNTIGGECQESQQCTSGVPGDYSACLPSTILPGSTVCNCSEGSIHQPGKHKCHKVAEFIGNSCEIQEQCKLQLGQLSECTQENKCECMKDISIPNGDNNKCLQIIDVIGGKCEEDIQCTIGKPGGESECRRGDDFPNDRVCSCKNGAVKDPNGETCYKEASHVDDPCAINLQCSVNLGSSAGCNNEGKCHCLPGSGTVPNLEGDPGSRCIPGGYLIGSPCYDMAQCLGNPGKTSICTEVGVCGCIRGYTVSTKRDDCLLIKNLIGDECIEPQQCQQGQPGQYSDCMDKASGEPGKICNCTSDAINEAQHHVCYLKATEVGAECQVEAQCVANLENSNCLSGRCRCLQDSTPSSDNRKCLAKRGLTQPCQDINQCNHIDHAICYQPDDESTQKTCECTSGYIKHPNPAFPNICIKLAAVIGDSCSDHNDQCGSLSGANCNPVSETCECNPNTEVISGDRKSCLNAVADLNRPCKESLQCQVPNSICRATSTDPGSPTHCLCNPTGFVEAVESSNKCLPVRSQVGQPCEESLQCRSGISENSECRGGECRCTYPYEYHTDNCYTPVKLGGYCSFNQECHVGVNDLAVCNMTYHFCVCEEPAFQDSGTCWESKRVGDSCKSDAECLKTILPPVMCDRITKTCTCAPGYSPEFGGLYCKSSGNSIHFGVNLFLVMSTLLVQYY